MIIIKSKHEIEQMRRAGEILANCHIALRDQIKPGVTTLELDQFVEQFIEKHGASAEQKGYSGYPYATCASINDMICHGFPKKEPLQNGDIVTIDMVVNLDGWLADSAWSYRVGNVSPEADQLLKVTEESLYKGIEQAVVGNRIGDISHAIQTYAEGYNYAVVRDFVGHGIGQKMHEQPQVPHYGPAGKGVRLKEGMVLTIEPMLNIGTYEAKLEANGWEARTKDGKLSAQYEHTIAITEDGPLILTKQM
ncbi:type I methionyl aminopeptidase [Paenibacillus yanchengensis]|uniref:Methionine aminopeptidase n=1 Tax=Paenibacillus yanchengensis TaxID=2035833 RepID=A0ABW4YMB7_9BACL